MAPVPHVEENELSWQKVLRAMQSTWREEQGLEAGRGGGDDRQIGSRLTAEDGDAGRNFLTAATRTRVTKELESDVPGRVLEPGRLRTNLLSSQPLAFNLFAELAAHPRLAGRALQFVLPDLVTRLAEPADSQPDPVRFEWSPGRREVSTYLGNNSAFDVAIDATGPRGDVLLGIEVKYHENLRAKAHGVGDRVRDVATAAGLDADEPALATTPLNQLFLDHMLACSVAQIEGRDAYFVLLSPVINLRCQDAATAYRALLPPGSPAARSFRTVTLEDLVGALSACTTAPWPRSFRHRYLDYDRVADIAHIAQETRGR